MLFGFGLDSLLGWVPISHRLLGSSYSVGLYGGGLVPTSTLGPGRTPPRRTTSDRDPMEDGPREGPSGPFRVETENWRRGLNKSTPPRVLPGTQVVYCWSGSVYVCTQSLFLTQVVENPVLIPDHFPVVQSSFSLSAHEGYAVGGRDKYRQPLCPPCTDQRKRFTRCRGSLSVLPVGSWNFSIDSCQILMFDSIYYHGILHRGLRQVRKR